MNFKKGGFEMENLAIVGRDYFKFPKAESMHEAKLLRKLPKVLREKYLKSKIGKK